MRSKHSQVYGLFLCLAFAPVASAATLHATVSGEGDCSSWANACTLSQAIENAVADDEIWVQAGTYGSTGLKNGVKIIGGFAGTETSASQSDPATNETILDGGGTLQASWSWNDAASTMLRGFTITNGSDTTNNGGGGLQVLDSSAMFVQCVFKNNAAGKFGAGIAVRGSSSPQFINCEFRDNGTGTGMDVAPLGGGAVFVYSGSPTFTNCLFYNNKAGEGGAILTRYGSATLINCTLADNEATIGNGGAIYDAEGLVVIKNSILWGNDANRKGDQIYYSGPTATAVTYSDVQGGWTGTGNIDSNPSFQIGATNYKLLTNSPCKNAGQNTLLPVDVADVDWDGNKIEKIPKDLYMNKRRTNTTVDMGMYETPRDRGSSQ